FGTERLIGGMWNGTAWQDQSDIIGTNNSNDGAKARYRELFGITWLNGQAIGVYQDSNTNVINWTRWVSGSGWINETDVNLPGSPGLTESVLGFTHSGRAVFLVSTGNDNLWLASYDGSAWTIESSGNALG